MKLRFVSTALGVLILGTPVFSQPYQLRLNNVDDILTATISNSTFGNQEILKATYGTDSGFVDISTWVRPGPNTIHLSLLNTSGGYTYGYDLRINGASFDSQSCGTAGVKGCNNGDTSHPNQIVYTHDITFAGPATTSPPISTPDYRGSFDNVDCTHVYGWAKDNNNPNVIVKVDISIDGVFWATIAAGDYRIDLANAGIGNHAFNEYSLPIGLNNGNDHRVRVAYSGTTNDLPGSPKTFNNTCGTTPSNVTRWEYDTPNGYATAVLEKEDEGGQKFTYRLVVIGRSTILSPGLWKTQLTMIYPNGVRSDRQDIEIATTNSDTASILKGSAVWSTQPKTTVSAKGTAGAQVVTDLLGLIDPIAWLQIGNDITDFIAAGDRSPSSWFTAKLEAADDYHVVPMSYEAFRNPLSGTTGVMAVRFILPHVDESSGNHPEFYALMQTSGFDVFSFEIGIDRNALVWARQ